MFSTTLDVATCVMKMKAILSPPGPCKDKNSLGGRLKAGLFMIA